MALMQSEPESAARPGIRRAAVPLQRALVHLRPERQRHQSPSWLPCPRFDRQLLLVDPSQTMRLRRWLVALATSATVRRGLLLRHGSLHWSAWRELPPALCLAVADLDQDEAESEATEDATREVGWLRPVTWPTPHHRCCHRPCRPSRGPTCPWSLLRRGCLHQSSASGPFASVVAAAVGDHLQAPRRSWLQRHCPPRWS